MTEDLLYWVWLGLLPDVGAVKARKLLSSFGTPQNIWNASQNELMNSRFLTYKNLNCILNAEHKEYAKKCLEVATKRGIKILTVADDDYPSYLKNIYDPPTVLYIKGNIESNEKCVAIVGSRNATMYGLENAKNIAYELAKCGVTVVSGLARGIDSFAHKGAINGKGRTVAVLGCGVDNIYPHENKRLAEEIEKAGAVISEYPPGTPPVPQNFPARNRIISGISFGTVVIEAGERSGSLITANFALEQGRDVFAVPGNLGSSNSVGTNKLIKDGAKMVTGISDILDEIKWIDESGRMEFCDNFIKKQEEPMLELDDDERAIAHCLIDGPMHVDSIAYSTGLMIKDVNALLIMLELKAVVEQLPGKMFRVE